MFWRLYFFMLYYIYETGLGIFWQAEGEGMKDLQIDFDRGGGLIPAIVQDWKTGEVLMVAYMNELSWTKTQETGKACFWSRSRKKLWIDQGGNVRACSSHQRSSAGLRQRRPSAESGTGGRRGLSYRAPLLFLPSDQGGYD